LTGDRRCRVHVPAQYTHRVEAGRRNTATRDLNRGPGRNWFAANLRVAAALAERDYDFRVMITDDEHGLRGTGEILPDALRWLWRR
jgi:hypothetical protein